MREIIFQNNKLTAGIKSDDVLNIESPTIINFQIIFKQNLLF